MMLEHLGEFDAAAAVLTAIASTLTDKSVCTRDMGGMADTVTCGAAITRVLAG
jgi:tartrate dehydrogenase/decarboxylase/D-malate dehydrogenase